MGEGIEAAWAGSLLAFTNLTCPSRTVADAGDLQRLGEAATADAAPHGLPWMFGLAGPQWPRALDEASAALAGAGLHYAMSVTMMEAAMPLRPPERPLPEADVRRVDAAQARDAVHLNTLAYGLPPELTDNILEASAFVSSPEREFNYVVYVDGKPVSTATAMNSDDGWGYVALVATDAEHRGKGYAELAMRRALEACGCTRTALDATDAGRPLYAQMGYESKYQWHFYMTAAPESH